LAVGVTDAAWDGAASASPPPARAMEASAAVAMRVRRPRVDWLSVMTTPGVRVRQDMGYRATRVNARSEYPCDVYTGQELWRKGLAGTDFRPATTPSGCNGGFTQATSDGPPWVRSTPIIGQLRVRGGAPGPQGGRFEVP